MEKTCDYNERSNIYIIGVSQKEGNQGGTKEEFEDIMPENFLNLTKDTNLQNQEAEQTRNRISSNESTSRHIIMKLLNAENKNVLKQQEMTCYLQERSSLRDRNHGSQRKWHNTFLCCRIRSASPESHIHFRTLRE